MQININLSHRTNKIYIHYNSCFLLIFVLAYLLSDDKLEAHNCTLPSGQPSPYTPNNSASNSSSWIVGAVGLSQDRLTRTQRGPNANQNTQRFLLPACNHSLLQLSLDARFFLFLSLSYSPGVDLICSSTKNHSYFLNTREQKEGLTNSGGKMEGERKRRTRWKERR